MGATDRMTINDFLSEDPKNAKRRAEIGQRRARLMEVKKTLDDFGEVDEVDEDEDEDEDVVGLLRPPLLSIVEPIVKADPVAMAKNFGIGPGLTPSTPQSTTPPTEGSDRVIFNDSVDDPWGMPSSVVGGKGKKKKRT